MWVLSWYKDIDLAKIVGTRDGSPWVEDPVLVKKRQALAYELAQYAKAHAWIPDPNAPAQAEAQPQAQAEAEETGDDAEDEEESGEDAEDEGEGGDESEGDFEEVEENINTKTVPRLTPASDIPSSSGRAGQ